MSSKAKLPALPSIATGNAALDNWIRAVSERLEVREGARGDALEQVLTRRDLAGITGAEFDKDAMLAALRQSALYQDLIRKIKDNSGDPAQSVRNLQAGIDDAVGRFAADLRATEGKLIRELNARVEALQGPAQLIADAARTARAVEQAHLLLEEANNRIASDAVEAAARVDAITLESIRRTEQVQANAYAMLDYIVTTEGNFDLAADSLALARAELTETIEDGISYEASQRTLLATQMLGADGTALTAGLFYEERTARSTAIDAVVESVTLLSAGAGEQFDWKKIWYFDAGVESWTGNGTPTASGGFLRPANHGSDAYVESPTGIDATGGVYSQIRMRVRKVGTVTWDGFIYWRLTGDVTWDVSRRFALIEPTFDANGIGLVTTTPGWSGTVDRIRVDLSAVQDASNYFEIDWVAIGRPSPGASSAQLLEEQTVRAAADSAESTARLTLAARVTTTEGNIVTLGSDLTTEQSVRSTADSTNASNITALSSQVNDVATGLPGLSSQILASQSTVATLKETSAREFTALRSGSKTIDEATLRAILNGEDAKTKFTGELAVARNELDTKIVSGLSAEASARTSLASVVNANAASLATNYYTKVDADSATAAAVTTLGATVAGNMAVALTSYSTTATMNGAIATAQTALIANYGANRIFRQASAPAQTTTTVTLANGSTVSKTLITTGDIWFDTDDGNKPYVWEGITWVYSPDTSTAATDAFIGSLDTALASASGAQINSWRNAVAKIDIPEGSLATRLTTDYTSIVGPAGAIATNASFMRAYANIGAKTFTQATAPTIRGTDTTVTPSVSVPLVVGDIWIDTANANRQMQWTGSAWLYSPDGAIAAVDARVSTVETAKIGYATRSGLVFEGDGSSIVYPVLTFPDALYPAYVPDRTKIIDKVGVDQWNILYPLPAVQAVWNVGLPFASAVQQVQISDGTTPLTLEARATAQKDLNGTLSGQYTIKIDAGGRVAGIGLANTVSAAGVGTSAFIVQADKFALMPTFGYSGSTAPSSPTLGFTWWDTTVPATPVAKRWNGSAWVPFTQKIPFGVDTATGEVFIDGTLRINAGGTALSSITAGLNGTGISVTATSQVFAIDNTNAATPSSTILSVLRSAELAGTSLTADYVWTVVNGTFSGSLTTVNSSTGAIASFTPSAMTTDSVTFRCTYTVSTSGSSYIGRVYTDDVTIVKVRQGVGVSVFLTNESQTLPSTNAGAVTSWTGAGGTFKVYSGTTDVTSSCTFVIQSNPEAITATIGSTTGIYSATAPGSWANGTNTATITFRATYVHPVTGSATYDKVFTLTKAKQGDAGAAGGAGATGERGSLTGYGTSYSLYYSTDWVDGSTGTSTQRANRVIQNMITGASLTSLLATTTHLKIGDTVTLTDAFSATNAITKFWEGTQWVSPGVVINGNLLVSGTIASSALRSETILTTGSTSSTAVGTTGDALLGTFTASVIGNNLAETAGSASDSNLVTGAAIGGTFVSYRASLVSIGVYGKSRSGANTLGAGVYGSGYYGAYFSSISSVAGGAGVATFSTNDAGNPANSYGLLAVARKSNAFAAELRASGTSGADKNALSIVQVTDSGAATPTFGTNKPGSSSSVAAWLKIYVNGTAYYLPLWT